jgi:hypothetical protein
MDILKTLKPFTWAAVEAQAEELVNLVSNAQKEGAYVVEYSGEIHAVNREILKANGFAVYSENSGTTFTIAWTRFMNVASSSSSCQCDPCSCADSSSAGSASSTNRTNSDDQSKDDLKKFLTFVLSSLASPQTQ